MKNVDLSFIFLIIGAVIGAGFSSGKEIAVFFSGQGIISFLNIFFVIIFLYFSLYNMFSIGQKLQNKSISQNLFPKHNKLFEVLFLIGLFVFITAMVAGLNSTGKLIFKNINFPVLTIISIMFILLIVNNGYESIKKVNAFLMPVVIIFLIFVCLHTIFNSSGNIPSQNATNSSSYVKYLIFAFFYMSYNLTFSNTLIINRGKDFSKKERVIYSIIISLILIILICLINFSILKTFNFSLKSDLPMLILAFNINSIIGYLFGFILWFSILTSLVSSLYILLETINKNKFLMSIIILTLAYIISLCGFNNIVNYFYPLQGALGLVFMIKVFMFNVKNKENCVKKHKLKNLCSNY